MKYLSRAIALSYIKHGESSIIAKILTEKKGLQSFIVKGARSKNSKRKLGYFQALQTLNISATFQPKKSLQYLTDISLHNTADLKSINMPKKFLSLFIAEVLSKILHENEEGLFQFIWNLKINLDNSKEIDPNLPILFLLNLSKFLGFFPLYQNQENDYFNLETGEFTNNLQNLKHYIEKEDTHYLKKILLEKEVSIPYKNRNSLLLHLIEYYKLQHHELKNITSHLIIESLRK